VEGELESAEKYTKKKSVYRQGVVEEKDGWKE
jgi:hypothetical protein